MDVWKGTDGAMLVAGGLVVAGAALYPSFGLAGVMIAACPASYVALRRRAVTNELSAAARLLGSADRALYLHSCRSATYASAIAGQMGFRSHHLRRIHTAAMLHDIGKVAIEPSLLSRPGPLTDEEFEEVKRHAAIGSDMLTRSTATLPLAGWVRHHHERIDGRGYPDALSGEEIPMESRIIAVADAYDAMVGGNVAEDSHPYRVRWTQTNAMEELKRCAGSQFDPEVVRAFESAIALDGTEE